jgi:hypothetical protein
MTRVRSIAAATCGATLGLFLGGTHSSGSALADAAQGAIVDDGAFRISRGGGPATEVEAFRITRGDNGQFVATSQLSAGKHHAVSRLVTDSVGTPIQYRLTISENGVQVSEVRAAAGSGRLSTAVSNQRGDESQRDYPMGHERTVLLDDDFVHQLYFVGLSSRSGAVRVISPHAAKAATFVIAAHGLEPVDVGGQSVTATHLSLTNGGDRRDVWVDADGRVLRAETSAGFKAIRDELPRKR